MEGPAASVLPNLEVRNPVSSSNRVQLTSSVLTGWGGTASLIVSNYAMLSTASVNLVGGNAGQGTVVDGYYGVGLVQVTGENQLHLAYAPPMCENVTLNLIMTRFIIIPPIWYTDDGQRHMRKLHCLRS